MSLFDTPEIDAFINREALDLVAPELLRRADAALRALDDPTVLGAAGREILNLCLEGAVIQGARQGARDALAWMQSEYSAHGGAGQLVNLPFELYAENDPVKPTPPPEDI